MTWPGDQLRVTRYDPATGRSVLYAVRAKSAGLRSPRGAATARASGRRGRLP